MKSIYYRGLSGVCGTFQVNAFGETIQLLRNGNRYELRLNGCHKEVSPQTAGKLMRAKDKREEYMPIIFPYIGGELELDSQYLELARRYGYGRH